MTKIEFTDGFRIGEKSVTSIEVNPLTFVTFFGLWTKASDNKDLRRKRIAHQTVFKAGDEVLTLDDLSLMQMPIPISKSIIDALDTGEGVAGKIIVEGDVITKPVVYKLGSPFKVKQGDKEVVISELEFSAKTFGEVEDILIADAEMAQAMALITKLARPIEIPSLMNLPGWALDRMTIADGITIMRKVLPLF